MTFWNISNNYNEIWKYHFCSTNVEVLLMIPWFVAQIHNGSKCYILARSWWKYRSNVFLSEFRYFHEFCPWTSLGSMDLEEQTLVQRVLLNLIRFKRKLSLLMCCSQPGSKSFCLNMAKWSGIPCTAPTYRAAPAGSPWIWGRLRTTSFSSWLSRIS